MTEHEATRGTASAATRTAPTKESAAGCCGRPTTAPASQGEATTLGADDDVRTIVREKYGEIARQSTSCCGDTTVTNDMQRLGYTEAQSKDVPDGADLGLGCGNPLAHAELRVGETVLDLGSGAGIDAFLAAREVGTTGQVIGVDMTPDMIARARANAKQVQADNVDFRLGEIEKLPVEANSVDAIISNCVINLSPDKPRVFGEAFRVLRSGGRLCVSDITLLAPLPETVKQSVEAYVGCVAGASLKDDYLQHIRDAGFGAVEVVEERRFPTENSCLPREIQDAAQFVVSVKVLARKP